MQGWKVGVLATAAMAVFAGWYVASPWVTLYGIQSAVQRHDVEGLIGYVDFDAVRDDLKAQIHAVADRRAKPAMPAGWSMPNPTGQRADAIDREIDTYVTPAAVRALMGSAGPSPSREMGDMGEMSKMVRDIAIDRETLGRFVVHGKTDRPEMGLIFTAHGLGWKLSGIRLPTKMTEAGAAGLLGRSHL